MNLTANTSPVEADASTSAKSNVVESTHSDSAVGYVEKQTQSANATNGAEIENVIHGSSIIDEDSASPGRDVVSSTIDDESINRELLNEEPSSSPFVVPQQMTNTTREKLLLERVFNLIKADQEQSRMENKEESFRSTNNEVPDEVCDSDEKQYKCDRCDMQFARHSSLVWHMQSHTTATQTARGKKTDQTDWSLHQQFGRDSSVPEEIGPFICDFCDKVFPSARGKRVHIAHMHKFEAPVDPAPDDPEDEPSAFGCVLCDREFTSSKALKVHISHMHTRVDTEIPNQNGMFACEICGKEFDSPRARKMHASHVHKSSAHLNKSNVYIDPSAAVDQGPPYVCYFCGKEYDTSKARKIHISHMHPHKSVAENRNLYADDSEANEYGLFACEFCKKEFDTLKAKKIHVSHKHKFEVPPPPVVNVGVLSAIDEASLPRTSNEPAAVACEWCGKRFQSLKAKKIHVYHMHKTETSVKFTHTSTNSFVQRTDDDSFVCKSCGRQFSSLIALRVHITHMHTRVDSEPPNENGTFTCELCGKDFVTTRARSIHHAHSHSVHKRSTGSMNEGSPFDSAAEVDEVFRCGPCNKEFDSPKALNIHIGIVHKKVMDEEVTVSMSTNEDGPPYFCEACHKDFESLKAKKIHVARVHPAGVENEKTKSIHRRYRSEDFVPNQEPTFPCHLCERTFSCKKGLSRHIGYHNVIGKQRLLDDDVNSTVDDANIEFSSSLDNADDGAINSTSNGVHNEITSTNDASHTENESLLMSRSIPCPHCGKEFETRKATKIHMKRMHAGMPELSEENAVQSQPEAESREEMIVDYGSQERVFGNKKMLTVDDQRPSNVPASKPAPGERTEINTLECTFCHIKFETVGSMHAHVMREHDTENAFTCLFCKKFFSSIGSYKIHVQGICGTARYFDGIYLFSCDECPKTFSHPKSLQRHWRLDHAHEEPEVPESEATNLSEASTVVSSAYAQNNFTCSVCSKSFTSVKAMAGHMSAHTYAPKTKNVEKREEKCSAEQLYKCSYCQKAFSNVKSRAAHMKIHVDRSWNASSPKVNVLPPKPEVPGKYSVFSGKSHSSTENLVSDNVDTKSSISMYQCPDCPKSFSKTKALANHSRVHEFTCKLCCKAFISVKALSAHSKTHRHTAGSIVKPSETSAEVTVEPDSVQPAEVINRSNSDPVAEPAAEVASVSTLNTTTDVTSGPNVNVDASSDEVANKPARISNPSSVDPAPTISLKEYACLYCPRKFPNLKGITTHSRVHGKGDRVNTCYKIINTFTCAPLLNTKIHESAKVFGSAVGTVSSPNTINVAVAEGLFKCTYCPKSFVNARAVAVHSRIHKETDGNAAVAAASSTLGDLKSAMGSVTETGEFKCSFCPRVFETVRALSGHLKAHSQKGFNCTYCDKSYNSVKALAGHVKFHKVTPVLVEPHIIQPSTNDDQNYSIEVDTGSEVGDMFPCQFCGRKFPTHRGYARHVWTHSQSSADGAERSEEPDVKKAFACRICGMRFATGRQLGGHMRHHSLAGHQVPDSFNSIHVDTDDLDVELNEEDQLICDTCDEVFECREDLSEHVRNHADPLLLADSLADDECAAMPVDQARNDYLMCHLCNRLFSGPKSLNTHMFKKHKKRKGLNGYTPLKMFPPAARGPQTNGVIVARKRAALSPITIDLENESIEDPIEVSSSPYKRNRKNASSSTIGSRLAFGVRTNGEIYAQNQPNMAAQFREKTYECVYCEKQFRDKSRLVSHVRTHPESAEHTDQELQDYLNLHTREHFVVQNRQGNEERFTFEQYNPADGYRCSECDETFREKLQMLIHMSYHMDNKQRNSDNDSLLIKADSSLLAPFKCSFCGQRFINKKYRNMHLCKRHRSDILQCEICHKLFICRETLKQHYEQHTEQNQSTENTRCLCEYCGMCFRSKITLKRHTEMECEMSELAKSNEMDCNGDCEIVENVRIKQEPMAEVLEDRDFEDDDSENPLCLNGTRTAYESFTMNQYNMFIQEEKVKLENTADIRSFVCDCCNKRFISESDMRTHENQPQKLLFCCGLCNLYFIDTRNAELHSKMHIVEQENELDITD